MKAPEGKLFFAKELHKPVRIHFKKGSILTKGIDDLWDPHVIDMKKIFGRDRWMRD